MKTKFLFSEAKLSDCIGISRTDLVKLRKEKLVKGKDWRAAKKGKGRAIELTQEAVDGVLAEFGIKDADLASARLNSITTAHPPVNAVDAKHNIVPRQEPETRMLKVTFLPTNKRLVRACNGTGVEEWVIVPTNLVWAVGDPLRAKASKNVGYLELVGKAPRWRGDKIYVHEFV